MRGVIREGVLTLHPPPVRLYSAKRAFSFPSVEAVSLEGASARLSSNGLFDAHLTLLGCSGSRFSQAMVDGWLDGVASAGLHTVPALQVTPSTTPLTSRMNWLD